MKPMWFALAVMAGLGLAVNAHAVGRLVDVNVVDRDSGQLLPIVHYQGRYYVAGEPGHRYGIRLQSLRGDRVLGVVAVDGINAISGDTAQWSQTGYVLDAYRNFSVLGWRKSDEQVADFLFTDLGQSYAGLTGRPDNVGVIGVAVFREHVSVEQQDAYVPAPRPQAMIREPLRAPAMPAQAMPAPMPAPAPPPAPAAPAPMMEASVAPAVVPQAARAVQAHRRIAPADTSGPLGTGHGEREDSLVHTVDFQRASQTPDEVISIYYDTRAHLVARGILPPTPMHTPQAFPGHYAPDP